MKRFSGDISIVLGGAAGQGVQTVETLLVQVLKREGYHVFACKEYMSRIRGGSNSTEIRLSNARRNAFVDRIDLLFAMDKDVIPHLERRITPHTLILGETEKIHAGHSHVIDIPLTRFANEIGNPIFTSTITVGVVLGLLKAELDVFEKYLREHFARKGEEIVEKNILAARKGYAFGKHLGYTEGIEVNIKRQKGKNEEVLLDGSEAVGLGALAAGCNFISSYPMSPGTPLLNFLALHGNAMSVVVDQAEDEIAAINMGLGAWYAGARAIVTTSGGGFALMTEAVSLAGIIETPIVVQVAQRPGPATGLPTRTEQADLNLVLYAGHGEFSRVILAPGSMAEAFALTQKAFHLADKYQIPVFLLTDQYFVDSVTDVAKKELKVLKQEHFIVKTKKNYKRYVVTAAGVSPRGIPGYGEGVVGVDSDEHDEEAHITESAEVRVMMHEKRLRKMKLMKEEATMPSAIGDIAKAGMLIVAWGSNRGVLEEALEKAGRSDITGLHFSQVYPLPGAARKLFDGKKIVVLENNAGGQFANLLKVEYDVKISGNILKYDGDPFSVEEVVKKLQEL